MLYQMFLVLHNTKHLWYLPAMKTFGETLRDLRAAQDLGLRETAVKAGISPAYLSRIERGKERAPRGEIIKELARLLAADPDVLFRLAESTDPELTGYLQENREATDLVRYLVEAGATRADIAAVFAFAKEHLEKKGNDTKKGEE